jgi:DNA-binding NtrC family response regulator
LFWRPANSTDPPDFNHGLLEASTAEEAREASQRADRIDLLVTDIGLTNDVSGTEVAVALARKYDGLPVAFVTGTPFELWAEADRQNYHALQSSGVAVLEKPFMPSTFSAAVEHLLKKADNDAAIRSVREREFSTV